MARIALLLAAMMVLGSCGLGRSLQYFYSDGSSDDLIQPVARQSEKPGVPVPEPKPSKD